MRAKLNRGFGKCANLRPTFLLRYSGIAESSPVRERSEIPAVLNLVRRNLFAYKDYLEFQCSTALENKKDASSMTRTVAHL
jgi:hypothetical protein